MREYFGAISGFAIAGVHCIHSVYANQVKDVVQGGSGLAFVAYPDLVTRMTGGPFWAVLFFAMLFTLGLDSQFAIVETVLTGVLDFAPKLRPYKTPVVGALCSIGFIIGLPLTTGVSVSTLCLQQTLFLDIFKLIKKINTTFQKQVKPGYTT